jgi:hypothetical protein
VSDDEGPGSFEERIRAIAREVSRSVERMTDLDADEIADSVRADLARVQDMADSAARWITTFAESLGTGSPPWAPPREHSTPDASLRPAGPHPLDLPTHEQGLALSALESGRWTVEPGSNVLASSGEGLDPADAMGLVGELRARDWIGADGAVTVVGRDALARWLESAKSA